MQLKNIKFAGTPGPGKFLLIKVIAFYNAIFFPLSVMNKPSVG